MLPSEKTPENIMPPKDRVSRLVYKEALSTLEEHLVIPSAPNSHYKDRDILESLIYLSIEERYAESGLEDLCSTRQEGTPSADTLLYRLKKVDSRQAYCMLVSANDSVLEELGKRGVFRKPVVAAIDLSDDNYYGEYNNRLRRSKKERGTNLFYTHASFHIVEKGKRITVFSLPVYQLDDHATICEELIKAAWIRGIRIQKLLIDRGFYSVDVVKTLDRLKVEFLMPAKKNDTVKQAIENYHNHLIPKMVKKFTIRNSREEEASFGLTVHKNKHAKEIDPICEQYIVFATNMKYSEAKKLYWQLPLEYKKRWGIETGFRVQNQVKAMTTSQNYTVRIIYQMLSVIIYNLWQLANILLALELKIKLLKNPIIKLVHLGRIFRQCIERAGEPPPR
jgi:hypothetical protein